MKLKSVLLLMAATILISAWGCGNSNIVRVSGRITVDGKPCPNLQVVFQPVASKGTDAVGPPASGRTNTDGVYELRVVTADETPLGATVGSNRVKITAIVPEPEVKIDEKTGKPKKPSEAEFQAANHWKSPLPGGVQIIDTTFDVPAGGTTEANFDLPLK